VYYSGWTRSLLVFNKWVSRAGTLKTRPDTAFQGGRVKRHTPFGVEEDFFDAPRDSSRVKRQIVTEYFDYFMRVLARDGKVASYADWFAGPGIYENGEESVPILIVKQVIADERLRNSVRLWFNEGDRANYEKLKNNIEALPQLSSLRFTAEITNRVITGKSVSEVQPFHDRTFIFADPCGYKGLSLRNLAAALRPFGNDCIFFFNYSRVNQKFANTAMNDSVNGFFEAETAEPLRAELKLLTHPPQRKEKILSTVTKELDKAVGAKCLHFTFLTEGGATSHHLVYATKNKAALNQMKFIYTKASSDHDDGVGSLQFDPREEDQNLSLFRKIDEVLQRVSEAFAGRTLTFDAIIAEEATRTTYTSSAYRKALLELEAEGKVTMNPPAESRRAQTLPGTTRITFPR
jgi:three-Cys-motif partner protein